MAGSVYWSKVDNGSEVRYYCNTTKEQNAPPKGDKMSDGIFSRTQLSAKRVATVLERLDVDRDRFAELYGEVKVTRTRKNRLATLTEGQIEGIRDFLGNRTAESEATLMALLNVKTRTTMDRVVSDFAATLI